MDGFQLEADRINYAELGRYYTFKGYRYYLVIYMKIGGGNLKVEMDDETKELTRENVFLPTAQSKKFLIYLANEINKLTPERKIIESKLEVSDVVSFAFSAFPFLIFLIIAVIIFKVLS